MTREEIAAAARTAAQVACENVIRDAAAFGWECGKAGAPLDVVRADAVLIVHDTITALVDELLRAGALTAATR